MNENHLNTKEEQLNKAQELLKGEITPEVANQLRQIKAKWKFQEDSSLYEQELDDEFSSILDEISSLTSQNQKQVFEIKEDLITQAQKIINEGKFRSNLNIFNDLFERWKKAGRGNKTQDENQWAKFNELRKEFFEKRSAYFENLVNEFKDNQQKKEAIIEKAKVSASLDDLTGHLNDFNNYMNEWKKIGYAGKEFNDALWESFKELREQFNKKRSLFFKSQEEIFKERAVKKEELICEIRQILFADDYSEETLTKVSGFRNKWREIGFAGRLRDDELYENFNSLMNRYYSNKG